MTTREALKLPAWAGWLGPILIAGLIGLGAARVTLGVKEDAAAHAADVSDLRASQLAGTVRLQGAIDSTRTTAALTALRDSAWKADAMRILLDLQRRPAR